MPPPPAYKTAPASITETGAVRLLYGYFFQALTQNLARGLLVSPAYAGKRHTVALCTGRYGDHPRACGEKAELIEHICGYWGSPPRMRGKVVGSKELPGVVGITPACAGKSSPSCCGSWRCRDHPRVCGEKPSDHCRLPPALGSPPHMRGKDKA